MSEHNVQTNASGLSSALVQGFSTPRTTTLKVKVLHKEKLSTLTQNGTHGARMSSAPVPRNTTATSTSRIDSIPTAHVSPNPASGLHYRRLAGALQASSPLRRTVSTNDFTSLSGGGGGGDLTARGATTAAAAAAASAASPSELGGLMPVSSSTRRWTSFQSLPGRHEQLEHDEFHQVALDLDATTADPLTRGEAQEVDSYHRLKQQQYRQLPPPPPPSSHVNHPAAGAGGGAGATATTGRVNSGSNTKDSNMHCGGSSKSSGGYGGLGLPRHAITDLRHTTTGAYHHPSNSHAAYNLLPTHSVTASLQSSAYGPALDTYVSGGGGGGGGHEVAPPAADGFSSDITSWQQRHQEQLRRQHLEAAQSSTAYTSLTGGAPVQTGMTSLLDPHKLDAVKRAADSIIREKDTIIERQKMKILQLERHTKESEAEFQRVIRHKAQEEGDALHFKLEEVQYENASLKARLTELLNGKGSNMDDMERKLAKTEYNLRELEMTCENERQTRTADMKAMQELLAAKDTKISEWKDKYTKQKADYDSLAKQLDSLENYLSDLPVPDEQAKKNKALKEDKAKYKGRAVELERRLESASKSLRSKDELIEQLRQTETEHKARHQELEDEKARLREMLGLEEGQQAPRSQQEELEQLQADNERLRSDLNKARKLLEAKHKKQQSIEVRQRGELHSLEERLTQEESTVAGLREELLTKEQHLKKLRASVKELGSQNQDLLEKTMELEEQRRALEQQLTGEAYKLERRLLKEMAVCFTELQALVQICVQRAEGQDPDISVLLGVKGGPELELDEAQPVVQSLKYKVSRVHELRQDIDKLRELISNKYAEDMGENLNCTTQ